MATLNRKAIPLGTLGEVKFAALDFEQLDELKEEIDLIMQPGGANFARKESRDAVVKVVHASLLQGKPNVTEAQVRKALDTFNMANAITAIFDRNGFLPEEGEGAGEGEAGAAASTT